MTRLHALVAVAVAALSAACAPSRPADSPSSSSPRMARAFAAAFEAEALDPMAGAKYLDALDLAIDEAESPGALPLAFAAIDALALQSPPGFESLGPTAIAFRSRRWMTNVVTRLERAHARADGRERGALPFIRARIAAALHELAMYSGDYRATQTWGERRGCANSAVVVGPLDWTPLRSLRKPSPIAPTGALADSYPGIAPFAARVVPTTVRADLCMLDIGATSYLQGLRAVVVDFDNPREQRAHFMLTTSSAAVLDVGGVELVRRGYEAGGHPVTRLGTVELPQGRVRAVVRVAQKGDGSLVELTAHGDDGSPLVARAPRKGDLAHVRAGRVVAVPMSGDPRRAGNTPEETMLAAAGLLALGDGRAAEHLLEERKVDNPPPGLDLIYVRAVDLADDIPEAKAVERIRGSVARALAAWPASWEARVQRARATERRKGAGEGGVESLREIDRRSDEKAPRDVMLVAYVASLARRLHLLDVAGRAYAELARMAPDSAILANIDARLHQRAGADLVKAACEGGASRAEVDCLEARRDKGDFDGALREIERLRKIRNAPTGLRGFELAVRISMGDPKGALAVYDAMHPAERRLFEGVGFAAGRGMTDAAKRRLRRDELHARDAPYAIAAVTRALGLEPDPAPALETEGRKLVLADQKSAFLPGAATAVLKHVERYTLEANGIARFMLYDLRRVSGTTDVAAGASSPGPIIDGRSAARLLRKRIHKKDGRILEPDAAANAAQQSDLSQLEVGDYIEQVVEGWALPGDTGQLVVDTPDLLPERTSMREASIEVRRATSIPFAMWGHPLLGKPTEKTDGAFTVTTWRMKDAAPRRIEDGVPFAERNVAVSVGTQTWANIASAMEENILSLEDRDPYVRRFAHEAAGPDKTPSRGLLERVVLATGKAVKVAAPGDLSDAVAMLSGGAQRSTARTTLELGQGSRSWVVYRALRELGVKAEIAVAEKEPYSNAPGYPAHTGRFRHPLVVAHLGAAGGDVWIDADVEGPPLPPGRTSPELRGRTAMLADGRTLVVDSGAGGMRDEIDIRLVMDERGDAKGTFTILLHGRAAQGLSEAFQTAAGTERSQLLRSVVLGWVPWADVEDVSVSSVEGSWEIAVRAAIAINGYGRLEGKDGKTWTLFGLEPVHLVYPHRHVGTLSATYASRSARQNTLSIDVPMQYHVRRRIELPKGATVTRAPPSVGITEPRISAVRKTTIEGSVIEEDFTLNVPTGTVTAEQYQGFVQKVLAVDDAFMSGIRVKVKP